MKRVNAGIPVCYCLHDDYCYLDLSMRSFAGASPIVAFVSKLAWDGTAGEWSRCAELAEAAGAEIVLGEWPNEELHRQSAYAELAKRGHSFVFTPDGDEIIEPALLAAMIPIAKGDLADRVMCHFDTYWKSPEYVIRPREAIRPVMLVNLERAHHVFCREFDGGRPLILAPEYGVVHHLSYGGPDERIRRKLTTWGHKDEVLDGWYSRVWKGWDEDRLMPNLHPTHPPAYGWAERIEVPDLLRRDGETYPSERQIDPPANWPSVSVVIPLYGGAEDITLCLQSLANSADLLQEVLVVDDHSPDDAPEAVETLIGTLESFSARPEPCAYQACSSGSVEVCDEPPGGCAAHQLEPVERKLRIIRNEENLGFAETCNRGYLASRGEVVIFLNSDTIVPRSGLIRLVESLAASGSVGAAGPYTNNAGYHQPIPVTYTSLDTMTLFAEDFALRSAPDVDVPILVGFCLAVRRSVIEEIGIHAEVATVSQSPQSGPHPGTRHPAPGPLRVPFDARYGKGLFEDNDLCYRIQRAGYKLRVAARSFVYHAGSRSLGRMDVHPHALLETNKALYHEKWREEIESGFASHLPGQKAEPIVFRPERHPDALRKRMRELARRADISLCMIVRDEERVLGDCLRSTKDAFIQMIVVDTGSKDRTREIAKECGAQVHKIKWPDSFAKARNESLKYAKGSWIFWLDADDTLPFDSAMALLEAALHAPKDVLGFVMPVQFVETEMAGATRVDHVKLFRNLPGLAFEGHIHEQILPSLNAKGGSIGRISGVVLHSGYDTSVEGQLKKRARDEKLLGLDLAERPDHPFVLFNLGMTAHYCDDHKAAVGWLWKCLTASKPHESHVRKVYALLGVSQRKLGKAGAALESFRKGLEVVGEDPELRFQLGLTLSELGHLAEAKAEYLAICPEYEDHYSSFDISIIGFKRFFNLASVCLQMDNYPEAKDWLRQAIGAATGTAKFEAAESLFHASMAREDFVTAGQALDHMQAATGHTDRWVRYYLDLCAYKGGNTDESLSRLVQDYPGQVAPRLFLAKTLLDRGLIGAAEPHLQILDDLGCPEAAFFRGVNATRRGDCQTALNHMRRARDLNPNHEQTLQQIAALERQVGLL
ncbi:MAG: glycosyltransferase [Fimbriimonadales bacterium]